MKCKRFLLFTLFMMAVFGAFELIVPIEVSEVKADESATGNVQKVGFHQGKYDMIIFSVPTSGGVANLNDEKGGSFAIKNSEGSLIGNNKKVHVSLKSDNGWNVVSNDDENMKIGYSILLVNPVNNKTTFWLAPNFASGVGNEIINRFEPDKTVVEKGKKVKKVHNEIYKYIIDGKALNSARDGFTVNYRAMAKPKDLSDASIREGDYSDVIRFSFEIK